MAVVRLRGIIFLFFFKLLLSVHLPDSGLAAVENTGGGRHIMWPKGAFRWLPHTKHLENDSAWQRESRAVLKEIQRG